MEGVFLGCVADGRLLVMSPRARRFGAADCLGFAGVLVLVDLCAVAFFGRWRSAGVLVDGAGVDTPGGAWFSTSGLIWRSIFAEEGRVILQYVGGGGEEE